MNYRILLFYIALILPIGCTAREIELVEVLEIPIHMDEWRFIVFDDYIVCNESESVIVIDLETGETVERYEGFVFVNWDISQNFFLMRNRSFLQEDVKIIKIENNKFDIIGPNDFKNYKIVTSKSPSVSFYIYEVSKQSSYKIKTIGAFPFILGNHADSPLKIAYSQDEDGSYFIPCYPYSGGGYAKLWFNDDFTEINSSEFYELKNTGLSLRPLKNDLFMTAYESDIDPGGYDEKLYYPVILNSDGEIVKEFPNRTLIVPINHIFGAPFQITPDKTKFVYYYIDDLDSGNAGFRVMDIKY